jgi:hypothetical protein
VPPSLAKGRYNHSDVVDVLKPMFYEKCYLCERNEIQDVEVEHFAPHMSVEAVRLDWNNLYYACSRCNGIKGAVHRELLDCADSSADVFREIILKLSPAPNDDVFVIASCANPTPEVIRTVELLKLCYNQTNTALRCISRESLIEQIYSFLATFINARILLKKPSTGVTIKNDAKETIEAMLHVSHPFSAFWRWQYLHDSFLVHSYPDLENDL